MGLILTVLLTFLIIWPLMSFFPALQDLILRPLGIQSSNSASTSSRNMSQAQSQSPLNASGPEAHVHEPSPMDVVVVKIMLQQGLRLPPEVVLSVLDFAEYWPHTTAIMDRPVSVPAGRQRENRFILRSKPLGFIKKTHYDDQLYTYTTVSPGTLSSDGEYSPLQFQEWIGGPTHAVQHPCRKIVFTITSHDQGWAHNSRQDKGSYRGSWTWFEAGLERFHKGASRPKDAKERQSRTNEDSIPEEGIQGEPSASATEAAGESAEDAATSSNEQEDLPEPYLPLYSLRPIHPSVEPDHPALHHDLLPSPQFAIQRNKTAVKEATTHKVVWSWTDNVNPPTAEQLTELGRGEATGDGSFIRDLKLGDVVTVWAKSRFGGWVNYVDRVKLDVYWAL